MRGGRGGASEKEGDPANQRRRKRAGAGGGGGSLTSASSCGRACAGCTATRPPRGGGLPCGWRARSHLAITPFPGGFAPLAVAWPPAACPGVYFATDVSFSIWNFIFPLRKLISGFGGGGGGSFRPPAPSPSLPTAGKQIRLLLSDHGGGGLVWASARSQPPTHPSTHPPTQPYPPPGGGGVYALHPQSHTST